MASPATTPCTSPRSSPRSSPPAAPGTTALVGSQKACTGTADTDCGAWVSFGQPGQTGEQERSWSRWASPSSRLPGAAANLAAEDPGWNFRSVSGAATAEWNGLLDRVAVQGGTRAAQRTFYTALYHSLLFPSVFSDDDGQYMGFDHRVHTLAPGHVQYSNISEADIYRSEVPLLAVLLPGPTSQMVQSLLNDAAQTTGGFLPKWVIADNDAGQWDGDSADPIIADAYAYGARQFNLAAALKAMVHGATVQESGLVERASEPDRVRVPGLGTRSSPTISPPIPIPTGALRHSSTRSTTSPSRNWRRPQATRSRRQRSPSVARTGRTCSIRRRGTWRPARPTEVSRPALHSNLQVPPTRPKGWPSRASRRAMPSSTPGPFPRIWPGSSG